MRFLKVDGSIVFNEPVPDMLKGLEAKELADLSWTDPKLNIQHLKWLPVVEDNPPVPPGKTYGIEVFHLDKANNVVRAVRDLVDIDPVLLQKKKNEAFARIDESRLHANKSYFIFKGKQIATDELDQYDISYTTHHVNLNGALPPTFPGIWKAKDGSYIPIPDVTAWKEFIDAMYIQGSKNFMKSVVLKNQIAAAISFEQVDAVVW